MTELCYNHEFFLLMNFLSKFSTARFCAQQNVETLQSC